MPHQLSVLTKSFLILLTSISAASAGFSTAVDNGLKRFTTSILEFETHGDNMGGMRVTAFFANGSSDTATWVDNTLSDSGSAIGMGWSLSQAGHNFNATSGTEWVVTNNVGSPNLTRLYIDGTEGRVVFDRVLTSTLTPQSEMGRQATLSTANPSTFVGDTLVTYRQPVVLGSLAAPLFSPQHDIYSVMDLTFTGGFAGGQQLLFWADSDNASSTAVPEPSSVLLLGLIGGAAAMARRRKV